MIYVMSDIHGYYSRYQSIMRQIQLKRTDHLYVLGDCVDRNPYGVRLLMELCKKPNVTVLVGNHEIMMVKALTLTHPEDKYMRHWYRNGGDITHSHLKHCSHAYREKVFDIVRRLPVNVEVSCNGVDYLLVHGGPLGYQHKYDDPVMDSVWMRPEATTPMPEGKVVIFGHTPTDHYQDDQPMRIFYGPRMIGVDCGAAYPEGRLACLRLDDMKEFYSEPDSP
ncbi:MAG: metallophosphoesterase [Aristaeellaceae bacterium]